MQNCLTYFILANGQTLCLQYDPQARTADWLCVSTVVQLRSLFFWAVVPCHWMIGAWSFKQHCLIFKDQKCPFFMDFWPLKMWPTCCLKTSGTDHPSCSTTFQKKRLPYITFCKSSITIVVLSCTWIICKNIFLTDNISFATCAIFPILFPCLLLFYAHN